MVFNRVTFFILGLAFGFSIFFLPKFYFLATYTRTEGYCNSFTSRKVGRKEATFLYPIIEFHHNDYQYRFIGPQYLSDFINGEGEKIQVIYNPDDPTKAYALDHFSLFGESLFYALPIVMIWSAIVLSNLFLPKRFKIHIDADKGFRLERL